MKQSKVIFIALTLLKVIYLFLENEYLQSSTKRIRQTNNRSTTAPVVSDSVASDQTPLNTAPLENFHVPVNVSTLRANISARTSDVVPSTSLAHETNFPTHVPSTSVSQANLSEIGLSPSVNPPSIVFPRPDTILNSLTPFNSFFDNLTSEFVAINDVSVVATETNETLNEWFDSLARDQNEYDQPTIEPQTLLNNSRQRQRPAPVMNRLRDFETEGSTNRPELHAIISRYFSSPIVCRNITNRLDSLGNDDSVLLNDIIKLSTSTSRPTVEERMRMLEELRDANLFLFTIEKWKKIIIKKGSLYNNSN